MIISDEIHCDLVVSEKKHIHTATLPNAKEITITMLAPSKTYNVPGLSLAFMIVNDDEMWKKIDEYACGLSVSFGSLLGFIGMRAAYSGECADWLKECLEYLRGNYQFIEDYCKEKLPSITLTKPEATYLLWMDFSKYGITTEEIDKLLAERGVVFNQGPSFGEGFELYRRFNIATSRQEIKTVMDLLYDAFKQYEK